MRTLTLRTSVRAAVVTALGLALIVAVSPAATAQPPLPPGGQFHALAPVRVLDTRTGLGAPAGAVSPAGTVALSILSHGGVPATGVSAVAIHLTITGPTAAGFVTAWPAGTARPTASNLNFVPGLTVSNTAFVKVGSGGVIDIYNGSAGATHFVADVSGWVDTIGGDARGGYGPLAPARLLDTRIGLGAPLGPIAAGATVHVAVVGHGGVPVVNNGFGFAAVALNVTAVAPSAVGNLTVWADGTAQPATSNLNFTPGLTQANLVVAAIGTGGGVDIRNNSAHAVHLVADVSGYFSGGAPNSQNQFAPVAPLRVLDTRHGIGAPVGAVAPGASVSVKLGTSVPMSAVALNITVTGPTHAGYLTAWPHGSVRPVASSVNFVAGRTVATFNVVSVGVGGRVDIYNGSAGTVQIIADESGFVTGCC